MKRFALQTAALFVTLYERLCYLAARIRQAWLTYLVSVGERDMMLLTNGEWTDCRSGISIEHVAWVYHAERRTLRRPGDDHSGRTERWPWVSVTHANGADLSAFFAGLRLTRGAAVPVSKVLTLMTHQTGVVPVGILDIIKNDGTEMRFDAAHGIEIVPTASAGEAMAALDYIR